MTTEIYSLIALIFVLLVLLALLWRKANNQNEHVSINLLKAENEQLKQEIKQLQAAHLNESNRATRAEEKLKAQQEFAEKQQSYVLEVQEKFSTEFNLVANKLLDEKSEKFTKQNQSNLDQILNPLKEKIKNFESKVEKSYQDESKERSELKGVISQLMSQTKQIQNEANNLTKALKGDNKKQGNWGEVILERVLENSGLEKGREYETQVSLKNDANERSQPDVVVYLPDDKNLIIDAKMSLIAYEKLVNTSDDIEKATALQQHIISVKNHIDGLSKKNYQHLYGIQSPDFVLMFIPVEASFSATVQEDTEIFNYAWNKKVVLVSPSTLLATLRTIASVWKIDRQNKNVYQIAEEAGALYDKFVGFLNDMENVGKHLNKSQQAHDEALKKLQYGGGNVISKVEKIKKLGAKTKGSKQIDSKYLE
jgi:DNA recombination protein RmuC